MGDDRSYDVNRARTDSSYTPSTPEGMMAKQAAEAFRTVAQPRPSRPTPAAGSGGGLLGGIVLLGVLYLLFEHFGARSIGFFVAGVLGSFAISVWLVVRLGRTRLVQERGWLRSWISDDYAEAAYLLRGVYAVAGLCALGYAVDGSDGALLVAGFFGAIIALGLVYALLAWFFDTWVGKLAIWAAILGGLTYFHFNVVRLF